MQIHITPNQSSYPTYHPGSVAQPGGPGHSPYTMMSANLAMQMMSAFQLLSAGWGNFMGATPPPPQPRPFFENFLEDQNAVRPPNYGGGAITQAYPSDSDHDTSPVRPGPGIAVTQAYPSDSDHDSTPIGSGPGISVTMAYPSDSDQDIAPPFQPGPGISVTMAYPSDSDQDIAPPFQPGPGISVTMAYPSDSDQDGVRPHR